MINNSLIKVQVKDYTSPSKPQRKLIQQRIKPFINAYGISPEFFEIKGKSIVFKNNNHNNQTTLNRSLLTIRPNNKKKNKQIYVKRPQTASIQLPNNITLPISNKYAHLFNEIRSTQQKPQVQQPQKVEKSLILEEEDEASDSSYIKKYEIMLKDIAELEKVKQEKIQELEMLQNKIEEAKNAEINSSRFIIKKNVHKPTLRERKDKAASLIQAHIKGRIYYKRFTEWKQNKEDKLRKVIFIQTWWKIQMNHLRIYKQLKINHESKQVKLIDGHTFLIITNYSYTLYRIRLLFIERMGVIKGDFRLYLNQQNCSKLLNEDISKKSIEFVSLMNIIINNLIKLVSIQDNLLIFDLQKQNLIDIPRLVLQVCLNINHITANQYSLIINQAEQQEQLVTSKDQFESSNQTPIIINEEFQTQMPDQQQEINNQPEQIVAIQIMEEKEQNQNIELSDVIMQKDEEEIHNNDLNQNSSQIENQNQNQNQEVIQDGSHVETQKILNSQNDYQSQVENIDKENMSLQNQDQIYSQNEYKQQSDKEQKIEDNYQEDLQNNDIKNEQYQQKTDQYDNQFYVIQDPLKSEILNQDYHEFQQFISDLKNNCIQNQLDSHQNSNQISHNFIETIKVLEGTQIIQNELLSSQRAENNNENQEDIIKDIQDDQELVFKTNQEEVKEMGQQQEEIIQIQQGDFEVQQQKQYEINSNVQEDLRNEQSQEQILGIEIRQKQEIKSDTELLENKVEDDQQFDNKVNQPQESQEQEVNQLVERKFLNSNVLSNKIDKEPSQIRFQKNESDQIQQPQQIDLHLLKSCESNIFETPYHCKETAKYLNSGELLSRTNFLSQLGQLGRFEYENNSLLGSGELKKDIEGLPEPLNLRNKQQELFIESQTFANKIPNDFKSPCMDDTFKLSTTFKFQFSSEIKALENGVFTSQKFDIKVQQQDSLEYSMDESQELQPIYITTIRVDDNDVNIFQIKNVLRFADKNNQYQFYDFKISQMQQVNSDYIIQNIYVYIIKNRISCIDSNQIIRIQRFLRRFRFIQSCILNFNSELTQVCLFKSFFQIKITLYILGNVEEETIIQRMTIKQRRILEKNFYSICPQLLFQDRGLEEKLFATIEAIDIQN